MGRAVSCSWVWVRGCLPACLSGCLSSGHVCLCLLILSWRLFFKKLDCERKACMKFPQCLPTSLPRIKGSKLCPLEEPPREGGARRREGSHWGTYSMHREHPIASRVEEFRPGAQATIGLSQGPAMAFCLRVLSGPDCRHCWCQPPRHCPPGAHPHSAPPCLLASHSSAAHTGCAGGFTSPWFSPPDLPHTSRPFLAQGELRAVGYLGTGFTGHCQWVWPCQEGSCSFLLLLGNLTWQGICPKHVGFLPRTNHFCTRLQRGGPPCQDQSAYKPGSRAEESRLPQDLEALVPSSVSSLI